MPQFHDFLMPPRVVKKRRESTGGKSPKKKLIKNTCKYCNHTYGGNDKIINNYLWQIGK